MAGRIVLKCSTIIWPRPQHACLHAPIDQESNTALLTIERMYYTLRLDRGKATTAPEMVQESEPIDTDVRSHDLARMFAALRRLVRVRRSFLCTTGLRLMAVHP